MKAFKGVQFYDLDADNPMQASCLVTSVAMCKTGQERAAFEMCSQFGEVVCVGRLVAKPVWSEE